MTTQVDYDSPAVWAPKLIAWAERERRYCYEEAQSSRRRGNPKTAASYLATADELALIADRARVRLVDMSELTLADLDDAAEPPAPRPAHVCTEGCGFLPCEPPGPPAQLPDLGGWLRARLGRWFPSVPTAVWAGIAVVLHHHRGPR